MIRSSQPVSDQELQSAVEADVRQSRVAAVNLLHERRPEAHETVVGILRRCVRQTAKQLGFRIEQRRRIVRQIVLVDVLAALDAGPEAMRDLQDAMVAVLDCFRVGRGGWLSALFSPRADRILFAATKADQLHHSAHDRLEAILKEMTAGAIARAGDAGAEVDVIALAAVRATREALVRDEGGGLPSIVGVAAPGEWTNGQHLDGTTEMAFFPGDLPSESAHGGDFRSIRFRPPALEATDDGMPALPHIRLDRALQFLIGDRLR